MKSFCPPVTHVLAAALLGTALQAFAGEGHDHGDTAPAAAGSALPRFAAVSELFELVGVLDGKKITLYLDRFADNMPVRGAYIELEIGGVKFKADASPEPNSEDAYQVTLKEAPAPGVLPITATVTAAGAVDLLAGELDLHQAAPTPAPQPAHTHALEHAGALMARAGWVGWASAGLAALALAVFAARRWLWARPRHTGGAA